jgi:hypothetical protein
MNEQRSKMAHRIARILATAESHANDGNEALRDVYLEKAAALQLKYAIDEATLASQGQATEAIESDDFCQESNTPLIKAKRELIASLAELYRGKAVIISVLKRDANGELRTKNGKPLWDRRGLVRVYAYESDLAFIRMMYTSLTLQMQSMMAHDERVEALRAFRGGSPKAWRVSYAHAWVSRVYNRLKNDKALQEHEARTDQPGTALVLRSREQGVLDHFNQQHAKVRSANYKTNDTDPAGKAAGWTAGGRADLGGKKVASSQVGQIGS